MEKEQLFNKNINLVHYVLKKYGIKPTNKDYENYFQEGCLGLWKAINTYDVKKSQLSTYATRLIRNNIVMIFRKEKKINIFNSVGSLEEDKNITYDELLEDDYDFKEDLKTNELIDIYNSLDFPNKDIFQMYLKGVNQKEIARIENKSQGQVSKIIKRTKKYISNYFKELI